VARNVFKTKLMESKLVVMIVISVTFPAHF